MRIPITYFLVVLLLLSFSHCTKPDKDIVFRGVRDMEVNLKDGSPVLKANVVMFNPNKAKARLKHINLDIYINEKKQATLDNKLNTRIPSEAEFTVPVEIKLEKLESGILNTISGILGGKKYLVNFKGKLRISHHGIPVTVDINKTETIKLR